MWRLPPQGHTGWAGAPLGHSITATSTTSSISAETLGSQLDEAGGQEGCGADHIDIGGSRGADALQVALATAGKGKCSGSQCWVPELEP